MELIKKLSCQSAVTQHPFLSAALQFRRLGAIKQATMESLETHCKRWTNQKEVTNKICASGGISPPALSEGDATEDEVLKRFEACLFILSLNQH